MYAELIPTTDWTAPQRLEYCTGATRREPMPATERLPFFSLASAIVLDVVKERNTPEAEVTAEKNRLMLPLLQIIPWIQSNELISPEAFDFTVRCAIAHHNLPPEQRTAREARIAATMLSVLPEVPWHQHLEPLWTIMAKVAVLVPDAMLVDSLRTSVAISIVNACRAMAFPPGRHPLSDVDDMRAVSPARVMRGGNDFFDLVDDLYLTRPTSERAAMLEQLRVLANTGRWKWMLEAASQIQRQLGANSHAALVSDCLARMVYGWQEMAGDALKQAVVDRELMRLKSQMDARWVEVAEVSTQAVLSGVPLGAAYLQRARQHLAQKAAATQRAQRGLDAGALRAQRLAEQSTRQHGPEAADVNPVHAWSVERLLAWIEGPVTQRPVDRSRILARERERREALALAESPAPAHPGHADADNDGDDDTHLTVDDALQATASFFMGDIDEMVSLARRNRMDEALLAPCHRAREAMAALVAQARVADDGAAHGALVAAETALTLLRTQVQGARADQRQRLTFTAALSAALATEPLVRGKRHGGVIRCPMRLDSWAWVSQEFHSQLLARARSVVLDGEALPLRDDQALALYVTGSSRSEHAFDVSVHLWQRRPGHTGPASHDPSGQLRMNTDDWFDTYIPCAVLHVPLGR